MWVDGLGFLGFYTALLSCHMIGAPPSIFHPAATKKLGRWLFLTYQTNVICCVYFATRLFDGIIQGGKWAQTLLQFYPLVFALGSFLTPAYYALDHFNVENRRAKDRCKSMYPWIHVSSHTEHAHGLPLMLLHAYSVELPPTLELPSAAAGAFKVACYVAFYLVLTHVNHSWTGAWPYPIIDDVTRMGGALLRLVFFAVLAAIFMLLGVGGTSLLTLR